jgi:hypothetical protein
LPLHAEPDPNFVHPQVQALSMGHHSPQPQSLQNELDRLRNHRKKKRKRGQKGVKAIASGNDNDVEMDGGSVKNGEWTHVTNRLYHLIK